MHNKAQTVSKSHSNRKTALGVENWDSLRSMALNTQEAFSKFDQRSCSRMHASCPCSIASDNILFSANIAY